MSDENRSVAIVTGGSRGIGAATVERLASRGYDVCINFLKDETAAADVAARAEAHSVRAAAVQADVSLEADVHRLFAAADELGRLSALVNNAGILEPQQRVEDTSAERLARLFAVNVTGCFLCCREAVRRMSTRRGGEGGAIVNVSSMAARLGAPNEYVDYAATKGAVDTLTIGLAKEVAEEGIRVNGVSPGLIRTGIHASGGAPDRVERLQSGTPMRRGGEPDEVAAAIVWLLSDEASYVTGANIDVSGGR